jgi:hypothetical protein
VKASGRREGRKAVVEAVDEAVAVLAGQVGTDVRMEVEVGPQMQGDDETTGEGRPGGGDHGGVRVGVHDGVRGDDHDDIHACVGAYESLPRYANQTSGRLHHPAGWTHCLGLPGVPHRHIRRNEGDHLATRDHGRDEHVVRTLPLNELPYQ